MKTGFITDSHLGLHDEEGNNRIRDLYKNILNEFKDKEVESVIHLGDCIDERTDNDVEDLIEFIVEELSRFDNAFVAPGNHDAIALENSNFQNYSIQTPPVELYNTGNHSVLLLETAMGVEYDNVGYISDSSIELLEEKLALGYDVTLATHYPLDYTSEGSDVFNLIPERAFPLNKIDLRRVQNKYSGSIEKMFCGHSHPKSTVSGV